MPTAQAADTSSAFQTNASVERNCSLSGLKNLNFGPYDPVTANAVYDKYLYTPMKFTLRCTRNPAATFVVINFDEGQNKGQGSTCADPIRQMVSSEGKTLQYKIAGSVAGTPYKCSGTTRVYMNTQIEASIEVYGQLPAAQNAPGGAYSDNVMVSVVF